MGAAEGIRYSRFCEPPLTGTMPGTTTGAANDLKHVTDMARRMVAEFGMSDSIGPLNFGEHDHQPFLGYSLSQGRNYSEETAARIDGEVRRIVDESHARTLKLLRDHRDKLDQLAKELLDNEVVEGKRVLEIVGRSVPEEPLEGVAATNPTQAV